PAPVEPPPLQAAESFRLPYPISSPVAQRAVCGAPGYRTPERRRVGQNPAVDRRKLARHLAFRDNLRSHPAQARAYTELKRSLAERFRSDREAYSRGKAAFIERALAAGRACRWTSAPPPTSRHRCAAR
ncbi:MAG: GrpB family protein, partial [Streptosporangiaceae bacterium]|nr:GrpB family protein [Streptosporangiaceae bacterium]